jgi:hypothetical protein
MSVFPKQLADELGGFASELEVAEDWDFWLRAIYSGARVSLQPKPLALYRWGSESLSAAPARMDEHAEAVLRRASERDDLSAEERAYLDRRLSGPSPAQLGRAGDEALRAGRYREAAASYRRAAELVPVEPRLVWKARVLRAAPWLTGPLVRARQLRSRTRSASTRGTSAERPASRRLRLHRKPLPQPAGGGVFAAETDGLPVEVASLGTLDLGPVPALPEAVTLAESSGSTSRATAPGS